MQAGEVECGGGYSSRGVPHPIDLQSCRRTPPSWTPPWTPPMPRSSVITGGNALKFYCSVRLDVRRIGAVKKGEEQLGNRVRIRVRKKTLSRPL